MPLIFLWAINRWSVFSNKLNNDLKYIFYVLKHFFGVLWLFVSFSSLFFLLLFYDVLLPIITISFHLHLSHVLYELLQVYIYLLCLIYKIVPELLQVYIYLLYLIYKIIWKSKIVPHLLQYKLFWRVTYVLYLDKEIEFQLIRSFF